MMILQNACRPVMIFLLFVVGAIHSCEAFAPFKNIRSHSPQAHSLSTALHTFQSKNHHPNQQHHQHHPIAYKHLFRHYHDISFDSWLRCVDPTDFLASVGFSPDQIQTLMASSSHHPSEGPWIVHDHLAPKVRLLVENLPGGGSGRLAWNGSIDNTEKTTASDSAPDDASSIHSLRLSSLAIHRILETPDFLDATKINLDRVVGPYLAYWHDAHDHHHHDEKNHRTKHSLLHNAEQWDDFVKVCSISKRKESMQAFCEWCNRWEDEDEANAQASSVHTVEGIEGWIHGIFCPGLIHATKHLTKAEQNRIIPLLLRHGHNPFQPSSSSTTTSSILPLHGAAGTGALLAVQALVDAYIMEDAPEERSSLVDIMKQTCESKHGATPFHWACAGLHPHQEPHQLHQKGQFRGASDEKNLPFESSFDVCRWMLQSAGPDDRDEIVNLPTWKGDTPLFWAAWAGQMANTELLLIHGADPLHTNNDQQTALHWAAGSGQVAICQALVDEGGLMFLNWKDIHGNTALDYAREHGHDIVVQWITAVQHTMDMRSNHTMAIAMP